MQPITAIVIDDDIDTLNFFTEFLEIKNIKVLAKGKNGKEAAELYRSLKPDVVFMDATMPVYDGFFGLQKIREINKDAIVIVVTAALPQDLEYKLIGMETSAIIYKPFNIDKVIDIVNTLLGSEKPNQPIIQHT